MSISTIKRVGETKPALSRAVGKASYPTSHIAISIYIILPDASIGRVILSGPYTFDKDARANSKDPSLLGSNIKSSADFERHVDVYGLVVSDKTLINSLNNAFNNRDIGFIDTEFHGSLIVEVALVDTKGVVLLDTLVNYNMSLNELNDCLDPTYKPSMTVEGLCRRYKVSQGEKTSGLTAEEIGERLETLGITSSSRLAE